MDPLSLAFGKQREAIECREPMLGLICSGRAGKTRGFLLKWLEVCRRKPGHISIYVAMTRDSAKRIAWTQLHAMDAEYGLGLKFNEASLTATDSRGSQLILLGANREDLIDVLRGFPIVLIGFDEAAFFRAGLLKRAVEDAVLIRLMDLDGECWVMSTPGYVCSGYHYDIVTGRVPGFKTLHWTFFDNPHIGPPELSPEKKAEWRKRWAEKTRKARGWSESSPSYVRDFLGRYVDDPDARVYKFQRDRHCIERMPQSWFDEPRLWTKVLGIDYGSSNATAWVLWAFEKGSPTCYAVKALKRYGLAPSQTADITRDWIQQFNPHAIVGDSAAKGYIDEARLRHALPIEGADKQQKRAFIEFMNDGFRAEPEPRIQIVEPDCQDYISELETLGWDPRYEKGHPKYQSEEDPRAENDACDAGLYGWRRCYAYLEGIAPANDQGEDEDDEDFDSEGEFYTPRSRRSA